MSDVLVLVEPQDDILVQVDDLVKDLVVTVGIQGPQGIQGLKGDKGDAAADPEFTAGEALSGHRMVVLNASEQAVYASNDNLSHAEKVFGMTVGAASSGAAVTVRRFGELTEPSWNWTLNTPIFLGVNGLLTQTKPSAPGSFVLQVAFPMTPTKVYIDIKQAFLI